MSKNFLFVVLGIFVAVAPFVGLPVVWRSYGLLIAGTVIAVFAFWGEKGDSVEAYFKIPDTRTQNLFDGDHKTEAGA